jgi:hypothetical protein
MSDVASKNPKATITALATGLESLSGLIKDATVQRICIIISPALALALTFIYRVLTQYINSTKGLRQYNKMILDFQVEIESPNTSDARKLFLKSEIEKCWIKINELRTENIKIL